MIHTNEERRWAEFLDRLTHDLREPLRSINVFSTLLAEIAEGRLGAEGDRAMSEIPLGISRMETLLQGVSSYSSALRQSAESESSSLQSAFKIVVAELDGKIRGCAAIVEAVDLPRVRLSLDRSMHLLRNLIGNSLRFRSAAPPVIRVSAARELPGMWAIRVEDNGMGIEPEECTTVFEPFKRLDGRKYGGVGLGLTICQKIVEVHGGTIKMESAPGRGSVCTFTLPEE